MTEEKTVQGTDAKTDALESGHLEANQSAAEVGSIAARSVEKKSDLKKRRFAWLKHHQHVYGWGSLLLAILVFFIPDWPSLIGSVTDIGDLKSRLEMRIRRHGEVYTKLDQLVPLAAADEFQVTGRFDVPVFAKLIWIDQYGQVEIVADSGDKKTKTLRFPDKQNTWARLEPVAGTEMVLLVACNDAMNDLTEKVIETVKSTMVLDQDSGEETLPVFSDRSSVWVCREKTDVVDNEGETKSLENTIVYEESDVVTLADQIRDLLREEVLDFRGIVFPHQ